MYKQSRHGWVCGSVGRRYDAVYRQYSALKYPGRTVRTACDSAVCTCVSIPFSHWFTRFNAFLLAFRSVCELQGRQHHHITMETVFSFDSHSLTHSFIHSERVKRTETYEKRIESMKKVSIFFYVTFVLHLTCPVNYCRPGTCLTCVFK